MDPTLHALALALPLCPVREETLLEAIYLENWNDFTLDGLLPAQRLAYNLLFKILTPYLPGHLGQLGHHSLPFNMFVHWHLRWNAIPECRRRTQLGGKGGSSCGRVVYGAGLGGGCRVVA